MKGVLSAAFLISLAFPAFAQNSASWERVDFTSNAGCSYVSSDSSSSRWYWDMVQDTSVTFTSNFTQIYTSHKRNTRQLNWQMSGVGVDSTQTQHNISHPRDSYGYGVQARPCNGACGTTRATVNRSSCKGA